MPLVPQALLKRAGNICAVGLSCAAILCICGVNTAEARSAEILIRSSVAVDDSTPAGPLYDRRTVTTVAAPAGVHIAFGRAADLVGRPVNYSRPIRTSLGANGSGAMPLAPGLMPSRMPVATSGLTSSFGMRQHPLLGVSRQHSGVDLAAPVGSPIYATSDGVVSAANWSGGYGLLVELEHGGGVETRYGHLSRLNVATGQQVRKGDVIGLVGSTGQSTGPHLHYEVRLNGRAVNPAPYLKAR